MSKIKFIFALHNHQPVGNFDDVFERAYEKSYKPFLKAVHRNNLPVTMHFSGELLSWIIDKHDGMQMLINDIVKRV